MKIITIAILTLLCVACTNKKSSDSITNDESINDSILLAQRQDSIERESIFDALGDTIFSGVCYGMNKAQFKKAIAAFKEPLKNRNKSSYDIEFAGYEIDINEGFDVEKNKHTNVQGYPIGLEGILEESNLGFGTHFFRGKLFSVRWDFFRRMQDGNGVIHSLGQLISLFEKKYGKPNVNNSERFNSSMIETGDWDQMKVIAKWETEKRKIIIFYRDMVGSERDKWVDEHYPSDYQYELTIQFLDKTQKKEVNEYIKPILQKYQDDYREKLKQDSIKEANAL